MTKTLFQIGWVNSNFSPDVSDVCRSFSCFVLNYSFLFLRLLKVYLDCRELASVITTIAGQLTWRGISSGMERKSTNGILCYLIWLVSFYSIRFLFIYLFFISLSLVIFFSLIRALQPYGISSWKKGIVVSRHVLIRRWNCTMLH
jgi:hypothetical protein